jgi:hypothetical protein
MRPDDLKAGELFPDDLNDRRADFAKNGRAPRTRAAVSQVISQCNLMEKFTQCAQFAMLIKKIGPSVDENYRHIIALHNRPMLCGQP